jgi:hypothetical protein
MVTKEDLANVGYGDVIRYTERHGLLYLVVEEVRDGGIHGQIASPIGVNGIPIESLLEKKAS